MPCRSCKLWLRGICYHQGLQNPALLRSDTVSGLKHLFVSPEKQAYHAELQTVSTLEHYSLCSFDQRSTKLSEIAPGMCLLHAKASAQISVW